MFEFMQREPAYTNAKKDWYVELAQSTCVWYDLLLNPPSDFDTKQQITDYIKQLQIMVESQLEKRFVYFLAARRKVRFCMSKKPRYSFFSNALIFYVEIGCKKIKRKLAAKIFDAETGRLIKPPVEISDRFITFCYTPKHKVTMPIYDFLDVCGLEVGVNTEVHYVGYTKLPSERPINGSHRGLSDMLYRVSSEEHDFFVFYNLFKVLSVGLGLDAPINFCIANSMMDEVKVNEEGRIIEMALIKYFGTKTQEVNRGKEETELENSLSWLVKKHNINSVAIHIEMSQPSELRRFFSRSIKPSDKHVFTCRIRNDGVEIVEGSKIASPVF